MKLKNLIQNTDEKDADIDINGITSNSNEVQAGTLFVALKGVKTDGAAFIPDAAKKGAAAVLADREVAADIPVIRVQNARASMGQMADKLYPSDGVVKVAVTGTNGKTSCVNYVAELLNGLGILSASFGTIGVQSPVLKIEGAMTTPDAVTVHKTLHELDGKGVKVVALEASSHGLDQDRLAGIEFAVSAFTNITQDHLDYHGDMGTYFNAKMKLFCERTAANGVVILNADIDEYETMRAQILQQGLRVISYGVNGTELKLLSRIATPTGQTVEVDAFGKKYTCDLNIVGDFQVSNVLCAVGMCIGLNDNYKLLGEMTRGEFIDKIFALLPTLQAPAGRLECVGHLKNGAAIYIDYAHTPDALERVLKTMRPHTHRELVCVFGCGGDRDKTKRPLMGAIAQKYADRAYVTDDNPRTENAADIRAQIKAATPQSVEMGDRHIAIDEAVHSLQTGDVLVIAGKGHETGQKIGDMVYAFDDKIEAQLAILRAEQTPLWTYDELRACLGDTVPTGACAFGISIDTRTLTVGDMYVAIRGERLDGHDFVAAAVHKGASICLVDHEIAGVPKSKQIIVTDVQTAFEKMGAFARNRSEAAFIEITGSSGKTTTKEMLKTVLSAQGNTYATAGNLNGKIGVPLTLARMGRDVQYAIIETGMDHLGDLANLSKMVRPNVSIITMVGPAHLAYFKDVAQIAQAKSEIFIGQEKDGTAIINADSPYYAFLRDNAISNGIRNIISFGKNDCADFKLLNAVPGGDKTMVDAMVGGEKIAYTIGFLGEHFAMNSLAVLAGVDAVGASVKQAATDLAQTSAAQGRGAAQKITLADGRSYDLIDDSYNANPASMAASIGTLGMHANAVKIALLGDMLELGAAEIEMHTNLLQNLLDNHVAKVYAVGTLMKHLFDILPPDMQGAWRQTPAEIADIVLNEVPNGCVLLVKSSKSTGLNKIIPTLKGMR